MIGFTNEVEIRLTPEEVFEFIANSENAPKWNHFVTDMTYWGSTGSELRSLRT